MSPKAKAPPVELEKQEPAAVWVPIGDLTPWAKNPRKNDHAVAEVAKSIKRFGFASPIIARKADGQVIAGHTRLKAAIELGLKSVPVRYLDLDPGDAGLLAIADNKVGEISEWDDAKLAELLSSLKSDGLEIQDSGFNQFELDKLLASLGNDALNFAAGDLDDQGRLDEKSPVICPKCSHEFQA